MCAEGYQPGEFRVEVVGVNVDVVPGRPRAESLHEHRYVSVGECRAVVLGMSLELVQLGAASRLPEYKLGIVLIRRGVDHDH